ncbi:MAG: S9 family peptidase [Armatimonadota bacterium]|nr:S9 family peptidase [Armatimonadota bacterium]MDR5703189.1 S9 family peptidase [Armatimonadota bacterium]
MPRKITAEDLFTFRLVDDPQLSPDGRRVAFVVTTIDPNANAYRSHIWVATNGEIRPFTSGPHRDTSPRWSPDGRFLAFLSDRTGHKQIWIIPSDGGEARQLTNQGPVVSEPVWSPNGQEIAYIAKVGEAIKDDEVRVITRLKYKADGEGLWDGRWKHLFVIPAAGGEARQLTEGEYDHQYPSWSPDGRWIAVIANRSPDADRTNVADVWVVDPATGQLRCLTASKGPASAPSWSPDGAWIAYLGHDNAYMGATNTGVWAVPLDGRQPICLTAGFDRSAGHALLGDMRAHPVPGRPTWTLDGNWVIITVTHGGTSQLCAVPGPATEGKEVRFLTSGQWDIYGFSFDGARKKVSLAISDPVTPGELWEAEVQEGREGIRLGELRRLTHLNAHLGEEIVVVAPERFTFEGADGWPIEGWLLKPPDFQPGRKYPAILQIHGGPHAAYGYTFFHEFQVLAAEGYVVFYMNPRGSQGYGQKFAAATHHDWGGKDFEDLMRGVDYILETFDFVDPNRLGVAGGSYGGFMTNWIIGHTSRFRAAITMRSISNHLSQWGTSDLAYFKGYWEFPGDPWENPQFYLERSPLMYVQNITTPLLILHSEQDLRCPIGEAEQLFVALKKLGREVVFVRFPQESHDLSRSGQPKRRLIRLEWILRWFSTHLGGVPVESRTAAEEMGAPAIETDSHDRGG